MNPEEKFIERNYKEARHKLVLADNALLQAKNTKLEKDLKELKSLSVWSFIKMKFKKQ